MPVAALRYRGHGFRVCGRVVLLVLISFLAAGCLHSHASLTVSGDDRVSGKALITAESVDGKVPFNLQPPPGLGNRVKVKPYHEDGRAGAQLSFHGLTFGEVERLGAALSPSDTRYHFELSRDGSLVIFNGSLDLTPLASTDSSFNIELSAPGEIMTTNGDQGPDLVRWTPEPGEVTEMQATYQFSGAQNQEWVGWALLVTAVVLCLAVGVGVLAQWDHLRMRRAAGDRGYERARR